MLGFHLMTQSVRLGPASERADEVDAVPDALLPLAGDLHARVVVVDDEERGGGQLQVVLLLEVLRRPEQNRILLGC